MSDLFHIDSEPFGDLTSLLQEGRIAVVAPLVRTLHINERWAAETNNGSPLSALALNPGWTDEPFDLRWKDVLFDATRHWSIDAPLQANGTTMLHMAIRLDAQPLVQSLVEQGALVDALDQKGLTPLSTAVSLHLEGMVLCLLQAGGSANAPFDEFRHRTLSPLMVLAQSVTYENAVDPVLVRLVNLLHQHGADPNWTNEREETALSHAVSAPTSPLLLKALIDVGADPSRRVRWGAPVVNHLQGLWETMQSTPQALRSADVDQRVTDAIRLLQTTVERQALSIAANAQKQRLSPTAERRRL